ncbi:MAG: response regulator transcription factor [Chloroflexi bacterium]|nr:response regulator transcription factor [Chloroflexota bacterium]
MDQITVLVVDDHTVAREGVRTMLETDPQIRVVGEAADGREALEWVAELHPHVVLTDIRMPGLDGLEITRRIRANYPETEVIILTSYDEDALVIDAVCAGAAGYLLKDASRDLINHTIRTVADGVLLIKASLLRRAINNLIRPEPGDIDAPAMALTEPLTEREQAILAMLAQGHTNKEISDALSLAEVTVKKQVHNLTAKLGASDRTTAAIIALKMGLIS